ncbi:hypothetical protein [Bradyrhizobium sp. LA7.1]|uniref:hypothetical protein n=1 Tax=Bradyrhizobium sp. LA7.1 TaxID=3156324 RepID=UPI003394005C
MDWFERLTGFRESNYADTRAKLKVEGRELQSLVNGKSYGIGELELVSLRRMHHLPANAGALFQVASQFNLLEMTGPEVTPEDGVTRYQSDPTQGPACAIAAGAATIYRNYLAPVGDSRGQIAIRQLDGLADVGEALAGGLNRPVEALWQMTNGYALCTRVGLDAIAEHLEGMTPDQLDTLRGILRVGVHGDVEVTDAEETHRPRVSQVFCSALPVAYSRVPSAHWKPFASLILEAAYEATLLAAVLNKQRGMSNVVLLTRLGGGAFGNEDEWIDAAIRRALTKMWRFELDVRLVSYRAPTRKTRQLVKDFC